MRLDHVLAGLLVQLVSIIALASSPDVELRQMVERDMAGDTSGRLPLASPGASVVVAQSRQPDRSRVAFELDADAIEVATDWRLDSDVGKCSTKKCVIGVVYRVVATTTGSGVPSWGRTHGREILPFPKSTTRTVKYSLSNINGKWKIAKFPPPYVAASALKGFFRQEADKADSVKLPTTADARAFQNRDVVKKWRQRQIDILDKLPL